MNRIVVLGICLFNTLTGMGQKRISYTSLNEIKDQEILIVDEADEKLLGKLVEALNTARRENWVDLHNLRVIKYGSVLHLDCRLSLKGNDEKQIFIIDD